MPFIAKSILGSKIFGLCLCSFALISLACTQNKTSETKDAAPKKPALRSPIKVSKPDQALVDADLTILLSGTSHPSHIGQQHSRELFARVKRWPELYKARFRPVYRLMRSKKQSPGSHVDFCVGVIARGDEETIERLKKSVNQ